MSLAAMILIAWLAVPCAAGSYFAMYWGDYWYGFIQNYQYTIPDRSCWFGGSAWYDNSEQCGWPGYAYRYVTLVDTASNGTTSGCEMTDFINGSDALNPLPYKRGNVALIRRGTCGFAVKVQYAVDANASAVIIMNQGNAADRMGLLTPVCTGIPEYAKRIPVVFVGTSIGDFIISKNSNTSTPVAIQLADNLPWYMNTTWGGTCPTNARALTRTECMFVANSSDYFGSTYTHQSANASAFSITLNTLPGGCIINWAAEVVDGQAPYVFYFNNPTNVLQENNTKIFCVVVTNTPTMSTKRPTGVPTMTGETYAPTTQTPTTVQPTKEPTKAPSTKTPTTSTPTANPTTGKPTAQPTTAQPTDQPTAQPTTAQPTGPTPLGQTNQPTKRPTSQPTPLPTPAPVVIVTTIAVPVEFASALTADAQKSVSSAYCASVAIGLNISVNAINCTIAVATTGGRRLLQKVSYVLNAKASVTVPAGVAPSAAMPQDPGAIATIAASFANNADVKTANGGVAMNTTSLVFAVVSIIVTQAPQTQMPTEIPTGQPTTQPTAAMFNAASTRSYTSAFLAASAAALVQWLY